MAEQKDVQLARSQSVQTRSELDEPLRHNIALVLSRAGQLMSPWWSSARDIQLRAFWKKVDHLAGAVYTFESRLSTIPFKILPRDASITAHWKLAAEFQELLTEESEFGNGWNAFYEPWVEDLITQDNGAFGEIIGPGDPAGPIVGKPSGLAHLDSSRCQRTGNVNWPVLYADPKDGMHKMHWTRIIMASQMPSPNELMNDVGFCAVSRCVNISQNLLDMMTYKQEKLGSRPARGLMITQGGLDPDDVREAFALANEGMDNQALTRYSRTVVVGHSDMPDSDVKMHDLASLPDGFDEKESVTLDMAAIALAFGVDARELFPGMQAAATRADALISHIKQRGKGLGQVIQLTERKFNFKFLPDTLRMIFDFQDDAQDAQRAEIRLKRSERHKLDLDNFILDERTVREQMLADGDLTKEQFERLELESGRLADGDSVLTLFFRRDTRDELDMGVADPLDVMSNDAAAILNTIAEKRNEFLSASTGAAPARKSTLKMMMGALDELETMYGGRSAELADIRNPAATRPTQPPLEGDGAVQNASSEDLSVQGNEKSTMGTIRAAISQMRSKG